jgi:hypothetical protein
MNYIGNSRIIYRVDVEIDVLVTKLESYHCSWSNKSGLRDENSPRTVSQVAKAFKHANTGDEREASTEKL